MQVKAQLLEAGAKIVIGETVPQSLDELCVGTCNSTADCAWNEECDETLSPWPMCVTRVFVCPGGTVRNRTVGNNAFVCGSCRPGTYALEGGWTRP